MAKDTEIGGEGVGPIDHEGRLSKLEAHYVHLADSQTSLANAQTDLSNQMTQLTTNVDKGLGDLRTAITESDQRAADREGRIEVKMDKMADKLFGRDHDLEVKQATSEIEQAKSRIPQASTIIALIGVIIGLMGGGALYVGLVMGPVQKDVAENRAATVAVDARAEVDNRREHADAGQFADQKRITATNLERIAKLEAREITIVDMWLKTRYSKTDHEVFEAKLRDRLAVHAGEIRDQGKVQAAHVAQMVSLTKAVDKLETAIDTRSTTDARDKGRLDAAVAQLRDTFQLLRDGQDDRFTGTDSAKLEARINRLEHLLLEGQRYDAQKAN